MCSSNQIGRDRYKYRFGAAAISMVLCAGVAISCTPKSVPDPANNARWQTYLKDNSGATQAGAAAYQRRQREIAKKHTGGTTKTTPPTQKSSPEKDSAP